MKTLILYHSFYTDIHFLSEIISKMEFLESEKGQEIPDFNMIAPDNVDFFAYIFGLPNDTKFTIPENSGVFRKPNTEKHIEEGNFTAIVALEKSVVRFYDSNQEEHSKITLNPNDVLLYNSGLLHSVESELIQVFNLIIGE